MNLLRITAGGGQLNGFGGIHHHAVKLAQG